MYFMAVTRKDTRFDLPWTLGLPFRNCQSVTKGQLLLLDFSACLQVGPYEIIPPGKPCVPNCWSSKGNPILRKQWSMNWLNFFSWSTTPFDFQKPDRGQPVNASHSSESKRMNRCPVMGTLYAEKKDGAQPYFLSHFFPDQSSPGQFSRSTRSCSRSSLSPSGGQEYDPANPTEERDDATLQVRDPFVLQGHSVHYIFSFQKQ